MAIHLGRPLLDASRDRPGRRRENPRGLCPEGPAGRPYLILLRVGFAVPPPLPGARCALTAPFHPYLPSCPRPETSGASERSEEHTSELQSLMRISYAVFCLK